MYRALIRFADLQDHKALYLPGDTYPREGYEVTEERLAELMSWNNKAGMPLIEKVEDVEEPKPKAKPKGKRKV